MQIPTKHFSKFSNCCFSALSADTDYDVELQFWKKNVSDIYDHIREMKTPVLEKLNIESYMAQLPGLPSLDPFRESSISGTIRVLASKVYVFLLRWPQGVQYCNLTVSFVTWPLCSPETEEASMPRISLDELSLNSRLEVPYFRPLPPMLNITDDEVRFHPCLLLWLPFSICWCGAYVVRH